MKQYIKDLSVEQVIERLKSGEVLQGTTGTYEMIDGIIIHKEKDNWAITPVIRRDYECYFDRPEPEIEIEVGSFYKTRNGLKAYAYTAAAENRIAVVVENQIPYTVSINGYVSDEAENDLDLVAPFYPRDSLGRENFVVEMLKDGEKQKDIAEKLNMQPSQVSRIATRNGLQKKKYTKNNFDDEKIKDMLKKGATYDELSRKLGVNYTTIARHISSHKDLYKLYQYKRR